MPSSSAATSTSISYGARYKVHEPIDIATFNFNSQHQQQQQRINSNHHRPQDPLLCHQALMLLMMNEPKHQKSKQKDKTERRRHDDDDSEEADDEPSPSPTPANKSILNSPETKRKYPRGITIPVVDHVKLLQEVAANRGSFSQFLRTSAGGVMTKRHEQQQQKSSSYDNKDDKQQQSYHYEALLQSNNSGRPGLFSEQILYDGHLKNKLGHRGPDLGKTASQRRRDEIGKDGGRYC